MFTLSSHFTRTLFQFGGDIVFDVYLVFPSSVSQYLLALRYLTAESGRERDRRGGRQQEFRMCTCYS
jgi:hypothetical protein